MQFIAGDGGDADRHVLDVFRVLIGSNRDLLECVQGSRVSNSRRRSHRVGTHQDSLVLGQSPIGGADKAISDVAVAMLPASNR